MDDGDNKWTGCEILLFVALFGLILLFVILFLLGVPLT